MTQIRVDRHALYEPYPDREEGGRWVLDEDDEVADGGKD